MIRGRAVPTITLRGPSGPAALYRFDQDVIVLGRSPDTDVVLLDPAVSRFHAELRRTGESWTLVDRGSQNGTRLNGQPISGRQALAAGDEIGLGDMTVTFDAADNDALPESVAAETVGRGWSLRGTGTGADTRQMVGDSDTLREVLAAADRVASEKVTVLITGENGTGKELLARRIHDRSPRVKHPFVVVNCPALPESLVEAELFGVQSGTATGVQARTGRFEMAQGGTLVLDEVGDLGPVAQAKLLRVLQEKTLERVGGRKPITLDVRLLAVTNHDLQQDLATGAFRRDLYHRLNTIVLRLPPLRERRSDIPLLVDHFLSRWPVKMSPEAMDVLMRYDFPGNVRELEHAVEHARLFARPPSIAPADLPEEVRQGRSATSGADADSLLDRIVRGNEPFWEVIHAAYLKRTLSREDVRQFVLRAYRDAGGSYKAMARLLRIEADYKRLLHFLWDHDLGVDS